MEGSEISKLATILRENGAEVLCGDSKLALSCDLLNELNAAYKLITDERDEMNTSFHVVQTNSNNIKIELFRDLQFLHDFMQKSTSLKLTPGGSGKQNLTDVSQFKKLKLLELHKVDVKTMQGIESLKSRLNYLICQRAVCSLTDVLVKCGGDETTGSTWSELKEAIFSHNGLMHIDNSLELVPLLDTLDLSHNYISDVSALNCLQNLKQLNLAYNKLCFIPGFSRLICNRLQVLVLRNNFIEDIKQIAHLTNLRELDLCDNCLIEHKSLAPLANLAALQWLNLQGNPLSYHPQHRMKTSSYLHANTATVRFVLDQQILSRSEQRVVGSLHPRVTPVRSVSASINTDANRFISIEISEEQPPVMHESFGDASDLVTSIEHLETKRQIEMLREQYGEEWLQREAGSLVQDALGLEKTPLHSTPYGSVDVVIHSEIPIKANESEEIQTTAEVYVTASENTIYPSEDNIAEEVIIDDDITEGEESLYLASIKNDESEPVILVITKTHLIEKEYTGITERAKWNLESLSSFSEIDDYVELNFGTVRNDRKQRQYVLEPEEMLRFKETLQNALDNKPPENNQLKAFKCLKCSKQFTVEKETHIHEMREDVMCPACDSRMVFEDKE